ncbi:MAG: 16S rRNA processing protein RimM, partial [Clostridia bacterium]|nr:16S rRNA processing protein RimM [Clostridia bacterium]
MIKKFLETGKIVGTHGIAGMVRIQAWSDTPDFLCGFEKIYTDSFGNNALQVLKIQPHGNVVIAKFKGVDTIEQAEKLRNTVIYIDRTDALVPEGRYFISDLIDCEVFDTKSGKKLGVLSDVSQTGANDVWHIKNSDKEYLVPAIDEVIDLVDVE